MSSNVIIKYEFMFKSNRYVIFDHLSQLIAQL